MSGVDGPFPWRLVMRMASKNRVQRHNSYTFNDEQVYFTFKIALMMGALGGGVVVGAALSLFNQ